MSARNPGGPIWWAHSITATRTSLFALLLVALLLPEGARADGPVERIIASVNAVSQTSAISARLVRLKCGGDVLCAARLIAAKLGPKARLVRVRHPDTDSIRRVRSKSSLDGWELQAPQTLRIVLSRFGRKVNAEIATALQESTRAQSGNRPVNLEIDLRHNRGGRFDRMLQLAATFTGPVRNALSLAGKTAERQVSLPRPPHRLKFAKITVLVGPETASSAEVFAALLRVHGKATILGQRTFGKNHLHRIIPVTHDWRLLVPAETIRVRGAVLAGGLAPDTGLTCPVKAPLLESNLASPDACQRPPQQVAITPPRAVFAP